MSDVPDIAFHKKLTQPPLLMKSFTVEQLLVTITAMVIFLGAGWLIGGFMAAAVAGAITFFGLKTWFSYMNTSLPPGYLLHRFTALFEKTNLSPGISPWTPISSEIPKSLKQAKN